MEVLVGIGLYLFVFLIALHKKFSFRGWIMAWAALIGFSCANLGLVSIFRENSAWVSRTLLFFLNGFLLFLNFRNFNATAIRSMNKPSLLLSLFTSAFIIVRNFFPQFDVDSLNYHLTGVLWHLQNSHLIPFQRQAEVLSLWSLLIGSEEFLLITGFSAQSDLSVFGGIVGGLFKLMGVFTVLSLISPRSLYLRSLAILLMLVDEHFLFSGLSRFVYISPSMIGMVFILSMSAWRALNLHPTYYWITIISGLLLTTVKYHGQFFFVGSVGVCAFVSVVRLIKGKSLLPLFKTFELRLLSFLSLISVSILHGWRLFHSGSPIPPYSMGFFDTSMLMRGTEKLEDITFQSSLLDVLLNPFLALRYPGIYSSQFTLLLILPCLALFLGRLFFPSLRSKITRSVGEAAFLFVFTVAWSYVSIYIRADESRYVLGVGTLAIVYFLLSLRRFISRSPFLIKFYKIFSNSGYQLIICVIFLSLFFYSIDRRYRNISFDHRPSFSQVLSFAGYYLKNPPPYNIPTAEFMKDMMLPLNRSSLHLIKDCVAELASREGDPNIILGSRLAVFGPNGAWPSYLVAPLAAIGSISEGGGFLRLPDGKTALPEVGIEYGVIPTAESLRGILLVSSRKGETKNVAFDPTPICTAEELLLVRLKD